MADIGEEFFLKRDFNAPDNHWSFNEIPLPDKPFIQLVAKAFNPGQGHEFRDFLLGKIDTAEPNPRSLPGELANKIAHCVNEHRRQHPGGHTAYICQFYGKGSPWIRWSLSTKDKMMGRFDGLYKKSNMSNLRIDSWHRVLSYRMAVTAFATVEAMETWWRNHCYGMTDLKVQNHHRVLIRKMDKPMFWFETKGMQRIPAEFISRMNDDARALVFPNAFGLLRSAAKANLFSLVSPIGSGGDPATALAMGAVKMVVMIGKRLCQENDKVGSDNSVITHYHSNVSFYFLEGTIHGSAPKWGSTHVVWE
jgi:hypothetical protein